MKTLIHENKNYLSEIVSTHAADFSASDYAYQQTEFSNLAILDLNLSGKKKNRWGFGLHY